MGIVAFTFDLWSQEDPIDVVDMEELFSCSALLKGRMCFAHLNARRLQRTRILLQNAT